MKNFAKKSYFQGLSDSQVLGSALNFFCPALHKISLGLALVHPY